MHETQQLAAFTHDLRFQDLPIEVVRKAKELIRDQVGVELACSSVPWTQAMYRAGKRFAPAGRSTVVRHGDKVGMSTAAFINGCFGHGAELDDAHPVGHGHPACVVLPTALATGEEQKINGKELITAVIAGYEVHLRIGWAVSPWIHDRGGPHYVTACGPFATAAVAARILGLDTDDIRQAMSIAGSYAGGLMEYDQSGGSVKRVHGGIAAQAGVQSALLAQEGVTGPLEVLEGKRGFCRVFSPRWETDRLTEELGRKWFILDTLVKPYSCCGGIHPAIDAVRKITREYHVKPNDVEEVRVGIPHATVDHIGAISEPYDILGAQFSTAFSLAITFLRGNNLIQEYNEATLHDEAIRAFSRKVRVEGDPEMDKAWGLHIPATVSIRTKGGQEYTETVLDAKGSPGNPLTEAELEGKFRGLAGLVLPKEQVETIISTIQRLEEVKNVSSLTKLLVGPK